MSEIFSGTVKFFKEDKGFGFIKKDSNGRDDKDVFVHHSGLIDKIKADDRVTFEIKKGLKGDNAINVRLER